MGGDNAPVETVAGAVDASSRGVDVVLVGDPEVIGAELAQHGSELPVVHAAEVIGMGDDPARGLREKPGASINVAARLVEEGEAQGLVSAGSTGAAMAAAAIHIGRVKGVSRPSIASIFPTQGSPTLVLDSGANPDVEAKVLVQFALMGVSAAEVLLGALHDTEHGQIAVLPLIAMCDRWDIGGLSTNVHFQTGRPTIFIYDGHPNGVGISRRGFDLFGRLVADAAKLIGECPCADGCPSCVQSPKCGNLNEPLHKQGALELMTTMLAGAGDPLGRRAG